LEITSWYPWRLTPWGFNWKANKKNPELLLTLPRHFQQSGPRRRAAPEERTMSNIIDRDTIGDMARRAATKYGDKTAVIFRDVKLSFYDREREAQPLS